MAQRRPPRIAVSLEEIRRRGEGSWLVTWRVGTSSPIAMTVTEAWHPHGRFRSSRLPRSLRIPPRCAARLEMPARIDAAPGDAIENCFLILRLSRGRERWRVLTRFTLRVDGRGTPSPRVEAIDVHPARK